MCYLSYKVVHIVVLTSGPRLYIKNQEMNNEVGYHIKTDYYYKEMHIPNSIQND